MAATPNGPRKLAAILTELEEGERTAPHGSGQRTRPIAYDDAVMEPAVAAERHAPSDRADGDAGPDRNLQRDPDRNLHGRGVAP